MGSKITFWRQMRGLLSTIPAAAGLMPTARLGTGTANSTTFLRGDQTYATPAATLADGSVTLAKLADVSSSTVFYRKTGGAGAPETQALSTLKDDLGLTSKIALVGTADVVTLDVTPFATQTVQQQVWRSTAGTVVASVDAEGRFAMGAGSMSVTSTFNVTMWNGGGLGWTSAGSANGTSTLETGFARDGAGIIAARVGTTPHVMRIYNTYSSPTNYERGNIGFVSNVYTIGCYAGGAGTLRGLNIGVSGNSVGFFGVTPVARPTTGGASATHGVGVGTNITTLDLFDGYTIQQVVRALRDLGLLT